MVFVGFGHKLPGKFGVYGVKCRSENQAILALDSKKFVILSQEIGGFCESLINIAKNI